ncbi:anhydro-N-acetylmuramic acid kinase [Mariniblastus sp.]|nr:anhydro-N-acetylmuramic acid kinase [Mariniblastus sp.]
MIFPKLKFWSSERGDDGPDLIHRSLENRQHRLCAGISLDPNFESIHGCLAVLKGRGKFSRLKFATGASVELSASLKAGCREVSQATAPSAFDLQFLLRDLADVQTLVIEQLKQEAGKYVDRVLAISVADPGLWFSDFDGKKLYMPMCDPTTIAESTGIAVIDSLPTRDLAVGGTGQALAALPLWVILADRNPRVAETDCVLVDLTKPRPETFWLPASDGLDAEVPKIKWQVADSDATTDEIVAKATLENPRARLLVHLDPKFSPESHSGAAWTDLPYQPLSEVIGETVNLDSLVAALLGMFHIDQLPGNLPNLTGARSQRILGRLTPGRPSNWRQLIRAMAQHQPAPMKLKDAI